MEHRVRILAEEPTRGADVQLDRRLAAERPASTSRSRSPRAASARSRSTSTGRLRTTSTSSSTTGSPTARSLEVGSSGKFVLREGGGAHRAAGARQLRAARRSTSPRRRRSFTHDRRPATARSARTSSAATSSRATSSPARDEWHRPADGGVAVDRGQHRQGRPQRLHQEVQVGTARSVVPVRRGGAPLSLSR